MNKKMNEQILQLNTDAGLANFYCKGKEPEREFINSLTRQDEGKKNGGYDSAIGNFFGKGKNLYIQYKIARENRFSLLMNSKISSKNNSNGGSNPKNQNNNEEAKFRQINALRELAKKEENSVIYAAYGIEDLETFKLKVENGESFEVIRVLKVEQEDNTDISKHKKNDNTDIDISNLQSLKDFINTYPEELSSSGGSVFSDRTFLPKIKQQFKSIDYSRIEIGGDEDDKLSYQFLIDKLEKVKTEDIEKNEMMFLDALKLINKYTDSQIYWATNGKIYTAENIIKKCAEFKREYNYRQELKHTLKPDSKPTPRMRIR